MIFLRYGVAFLAVCSCEAGAQEPAAPDGILARWAAEGSTATYETLKTWSDRLCKEVPLGDAQALGRLLEIARDKGQNMGSRALAIHAACELADDVHAHAILNLVKDYRAGRMISSGVSDDALRQRERDSHVLLVRGIVSGDFARLVDVLEDDSEMFMFLVDYYAHDTVPGIRTKVARLITKCNVSVDVRREALIKLVAHANKRFGTVNAVLLDSLDPLAFPRLRELVRTTGSPQTFHWSGADALSHLGDEDIVPDLESLRVDFLAKSPNYELRLRQFIWRIKVQHPPTKLLDYISSVGFFRDRGGRSWALRRAHSLALAPGGIREAILTHDRNATTRLERLELPQLKQLGLGFGVLQASDLPNVEVPNVRCTP